MPIAQRNRFKKWVFQRRTLIASLCLFFITLFLYWPVTKYDFVNLDDDAYVYDNPNVISGISLANVRWALTSGHAGNWHPLTWVSHMLDASMHGGFAGGHHLTNILLHAVNTVILFWLLLRLTKDFAPSLLVAALFGWHPLHVESVAWIAERKDVLSAFFFLLTLWSYSVYVKRKSQGAYLITLFLFLCGLMAKPMLVTLPVVLLLLDYWPFQRNSTGGKQDTLKLWWEKVPFFVLSLGCCIITVIVQHAEGAVRTTHDIPLLLRVLNSIRAYVIYVVKMVWPVNLAVFYPLPSKLPWGSALLAMLVLMAISYFVFRRRLVFPWLVTGWVWFLVTLLPVIGLVQVGSQAWADRYSYIPSIGLTIMLSWSLSALMRGLPRIESYGFALTALALGICMVATRMQLKYWQNSITLFSHALSITPSNPFSENGLGAGLSQAGRGAEAIPHYEAVIREDPSDVKARYNLGIEEAAAGQFKEAITNFKEVLKRQPTSEVVQNDLGTVLALSGQVDEAIDHFKEAIRLNPKFPTPYFNCAMALQRNGNGAGALQDYEQALKLEPETPEILNQFAYFLAMCPDATIRDPARSLELTKRMDTMTEHSVPRFLKALALSYAVNGDFAAANATAQLALARANAKKLTVLATNIQIDLKSYQVNEIPPVDWREAANFFNRH